MMNFTELLALDRALRDTPALTLYLDVRGGNPAWRTAWRRALKAEEVRLRDELCGASQDEHEAFSRDVEALEAHLAHRRGVLEAPGWLAVVAGGEVRLDVPLLGVVPTHGHWGRGVALAPFLCVPCAGQGAWVVIVDSRAARIFHCSVHHVHRVDTLRTVVLVEPRLPAGVARRGEVRRGTRGGLGREAAERERQKARARMMVAMAEHVRAFTPAEPVFVGGTPQLLADAVNAIEMAGVTPVVETPVLGARARVIEIFRAVREGLVLLRQAADAALVDELMRRTAADNLGATGATVTGSALDDNAVSTLVLSDTFVAAQPDVAEVFVRAALAQDAEISVVCGEAAQRLEEVGGAGVLLQCPALRKQPVSDGELASI